jgi:hypothetical protein
MSEEAWMHLCLQPLSLESERLVAAAAVVEVVAVAVGEAQLV